MRFEFSSLDTVVKHGFDTVIDVRSPGEFSEDHVPGAVNLPVLDNFERAEVGTIYKQESPFKARKLGAALVFRNAANHIENSLSHHEGAWRPLVYCWRGGQRSGAFTWMLREIGWRAEVLDGGYRSYRRQVVKTLYDTPLDLKLVQLGGYTGTAKTEILQRLCGLGVQVLDLEGLAHHRGSLLGAMPGGQPSQKRFESKLVLALAELDPTRPVVVEAESSKIGELTLPPSLWGSMKEAPWLEVSAPLAARARYLARSYADVLEDSEELVRRLQPLRHFRGHAVVDRWMALIDAGDRQRLCHDLAQNHYDPAYDKSLRFVSPSILQRFEMTELSASALDSLANRIATSVQRMEM